MIFRKHSRRRGVTLTELLVASAIMAILLSILLPVLTSQKRSADAARCVSNLRQLGTALVMYAAENNGYLPPSYASPGLPGTALGERLWYQYLQHRDVGVYDNGGVLPNANFAPNSSSLLTPYNCPSNPYRTGLWNTPNYAYSRALGFTSGSISTRARLAALESPGKVVMLVDAGFRVDSAQSPSVGPPKTVCYATTFVGETFNWQRSVNFDAHRGRAHFLLGDGHVEALTAAEVERRGSGTSPTLLWSRDNADRSTSYW